MRKKRQMVRPKTSAKPERLPSFQAWAAPQTLYFMIRRMYSSSESTM